MGSSFDIDGNGARRRCGARNFEVLTAIATTNQIELKTKPLETGCREVERPGDFLTMLGWVLSSEQFIKALESSASSA